tara:strand:+ start:3491 stop:4627 length:1137 start_codon:yes stop_codon:yes gene_type:complete
MKIEYYVNKKKYDIKFCPDREGIKIKRKSKSYTTIAKDLKRDYLNQQVLLVFDKKISKEITKYIIHDLKISYPKLSILYVDGEKVNKDLKVLFKILDSFFDKKFTKKSILISCGGGVIGDVCGLASCLYLRGLIHYHIPSTMTAIIDSCVGGKTAINYRGVINSIGTYYHPEKIYISKNILNLLPLREYKAGIPEIIKCSLIDKNPTIKLLKNKNAVLKKNFNYVSKIIKYTLQTKVKFFQNDVYEEGKRLNLNFGHTFAHAIEMSLKNNSKKDLIRHGEAVGIGILCEIYYANGRDKNYYLTKEILNLYKLPINLKNFIRSSQIKKLKKEIFNNIFLDKKRVNKFPRYINLTKLGSSKISEMRNFERIKETIDKTIF